MTDLISHKIGRRRLMQQGAAVTAGMVIAGMGPVRALAATGTRTAGAARRRAAQAGTGFVFVGTNRNNTSDPAQPANQIAMYRRDADGQLALIDHFDTGGQGSGPGQRFAGDGLGAGDSVRLSTDNRWLFVANAGSNTVSVFAVGEEALTLVDVAPTGDGSQGHRFPNSVTQHGDLVYVLNSADEGSITGFRISDAGILAPLPDSTRTIDANQRRFAPDALLNPTQISFTPDGSQLVVTIKDGPKAEDAPGVTPSGPGRVLVWNMDANGLPSADYARTDFANRGPFGFSFDAKGRLLVALFIGGGLRGDRRGAGADGRRRLLPDRRGRHADGDLGLRPRSPGRHLLARQQRHLRLRRQLHLRHRLQLHDRRRRQPHPPGGGGRRDRPPRQPRRAPPRSTCGSARTAASSTWCCPAPARSPVGRSPATAR